MAKLTALPSEVTRPTLSLILISLLSVLSGIAIHVLAFQKGPGSSVPHISKLANEQIIQLLPDDFNRTWKLKPHNGNRVLVFLIAFFKSIVQDRTAFGVSCRDVALSKALLMREGFLLARA